ncbi:hypothetical protein BRC64_08435 [Halobacteriales archaeon QH_10_67_22]|nr:MAG: hypothetical protein BRC64_08435 [Halobacteriales archaeon QH_10_67_22]
MGGASGATLISPEQSEQASILAGMAGSGTAEDPYEITNATELQAMNEDLDAHYVLVEDIDASGTRSWNGGQGFDPIGDSRADFTGTFDGQNHTISGLSIRRDGTSSVGLFAEIEESATARDVRLTDATVSGDQRVGGLAGTLGGKAVGIGVSGEVSGTSKIGGIAGNTLEESLITESFATANVEGEGKIGGLVGKTRGAVLRSYATGAVSGSFTVGGLIGEMASSGPSVRNSYATGSVSGRTTVGGLVGEIGRTGSLTKSYASGPVSGSEDVGGVVGIGGNYVSDAYWNVETAGVDDPAVGYSNTDRQFTGLTTEEMTGSAAGENMDALDTEFAWTMTDNYPVLQWQVDSISLSVPDQVITGQPADVTASAALTDGRSVPVTETADYSVNESFLSVSDGTLETTDTGTVELTATVGDTSTTETIDVVTPADISLTDATLPYDRVGTDVDAPMSTAKSSNHGLSTSRATPSRQSSTTGRHRAPASTKSPSTIPVWVR